MPRMSALNRGTSIVDTENLTNKSPYFGNGAILEIS